MMLGCNYWASNAGTEMWRNYDREAIKKDLKTLSENGVEYLRVFPNWRDFQPIEAMYGACMNFREYRLSGERKAQNIYYLDEEMLDKFEDFMDIAAEYGMKLIIGLITGWMSGRMFVPTALLGKNLYLDRECLYFQQLYVEGLVSRFMHHKAIYAWDHGNECNCMGDPADHIGADMWTRMISNAVYAHDKNHPLISGIHALSPDKIWQVRGQAEACDMLVTHPYPFWGVHTTNDPMKNIRTTLYSAAITRLYSDLGKKPCLIEEIGTMGPSVTSEEFAADFLRVNAFSGYANGSPGIMWWCANDQEKLMTAPYTWTMCENELGMITSDGTPKPVLKEMQRLSKVFKGFDFTLPKASTDAVCLVSRGQDINSVAYMTYILAKQAKLNIEFADSQYEIPEAKVYMLPSINGSEIMPKENYLALLEKVKNGAVLYISTDYSILSGFEALTGNRILDRDSSSFTDKLILNGKEIEYTASGHVYIENITSEQVQSPEITKNAYGKGAVYYVNFPAEAMLIGESGGFDRNVSEIYSEIFRDIIESHPIKINNENVALTLHEDGNRIFAVAVNHSETAQSLDFSTELTLVKVHYGDMKNCSPLDAVIAEFERG